MAKRTFKAGATSQTIDVFIQDSSSTTGAGLSGLAYNSSGLKAYYRKGATGSATAITLATQTVGGAWSSGGFVEIDATNMKGVYRLDVPDTVFASSPWATIYVYGATNAAPVVAEVEIVAYDPFDTVRLGLTAMPNVASGSAGAIVTAGTGTAQLSTSSGQVILQTGTGTGQLDFTSGVVKANVTQFGGSAGTFASGIPDVNTTKISGTAQTARDIGTSVLLSSGTGTGQLSLSSGAVLLQATQTGVTIPTVTNLTNAPGAGDFTATMKTSIGTAVAASAVASVTGAVGSIGAGGITATSIASDAITAAKIADGAIDTATFASGTTIPRCTLTDTVTAVTGLTASNLDATVSSRMATYTQPTGFLAATFPGTVASPTNITAGTITTVTNLTNAATSGDLTATMKTSVNDQVVDALATDTYAEPGQGTPAATLSLSAKIGYLFKAWRNKSTQTSTAYNLFNDDAATVDQKATTSDDATTFTRGEISTGP